LAANLVHARHKVTHEPDGGRVGDACLGPGFDPTSLRLPLTCHGQTRADSEAPQTLY
jgi:hypothetical protein